MIITIVGSGGVEGLEDALVGVDVVMACNVACVLVKADIVIVVESAAARKYRDEMKTAVRAGAQLHAEPRAASQFLGGSAGRQRKADNQWKVHTRLDMRYEHGATGYVKGRPVYGTCGAVAIQHAVDLGATEVRMVGFLGYRDDRFATSLQEKILAFCAADCPHVEFVVWGETLYELPVSDNFKHIT